MDPKDVGNEEAKIKIGRFVLVIGRIGAVQHDEPLTRVTLKSVLDNHHRIGNLDGIRTCSWTAANQLPVDLDVVSFERLLLPCLDPEDGRVVMVILLDVVEHQLRWYSVPVFVTSQCKSRPSGCSVHGHTPVQPYTGPHLILTSLGTTSYSCQISLQS